MSDRTAVITLACALTVLIAVLIGAAAGYVARLDGMSCGSELGFSWRPGGLEAREALKCAFNDRFGMQ